MIFIFQGVSNENMASPPGPSSSSSRGPSSSGNLMKNVAPLVQLDESHDKSEKTHTATPLRTPVSQPFSTYDKQQIQQNRQQSQEDSFVHVDLPTTSQQRGHGSSSCEVTPTNTSRKLGEAEPMFQMSDISLSEHSHQQQQQHKK